ncbi:MAG: carbohydrate ABC transporter permease [Spirochaetes bacterium]|nr:carbohydrate ABC transporter permease [Spirochaetota bacterium]
MELFNVKRSISKIITYLVLGVGGMIMIFPFYWMAMSSLKSPDEIIKFPPTLIPEAKYYIENESSDEDMERVEIIQEIGDKVKVKIIRGLDIGKVITLPKEKLIKKRFIFENYLRAWLAAPFDRYFLNNMFMASSVTFLGIITSLLAGFAFAKMNFPFKKSLFMILIATLMIPGQMLLIPNYIILAKMRWINTYYALIIPLSVQIFSIYFLTQFIETLPQDIFDAAAIDGCTPLQVLKEIIIPLSRTVILTTGLIAFIGSWNALLWPLIVTNSPEMRTLQVGLAVFRQESGTDWELLTAAATFSLAPLILMFFFVQKHYIEGIARSGLK